MTTARVVFYGKDAANRVNLWVTDGSSAGTSELTVTGVSSGGLFSSGIPDFTILGGTALSASPAAAASAIPARHGTRSAPATTTATAAPTSAFRTTAANSPSGS